MGLIVGGEEGDVLPWTEVQKQPQGSRPCNRQIFIGAEVGGGSQNRHSEVTAAQSQDGAAAAGNTRHVFPTNTPPDPMG